MQKNIFWLLLISISFIGLALRLVDYDRVPPFGETKDEFMYPWAGISLLQTGIPTSWADFYSYSKKTAVTYWGTSFNLVSPWNEKPPLYPLLAGSWALINGENQFNQIRLSTIRQVPIFLNFFAILFLGLLVKEVFDKKTAILAAILYATIPTIVMANRLSLIENLLIPLSLFTLWVFYKFKDKNFMPYLVGLGSGLTLITKNTGLALPLAIFIIFFQKKQWKNLLITGSITLLFALIHPLMGVYYNWQLYVNVLNEYRQYMLVGLPETIFSLFRYPVIGHKEQVFPDGSMLLGIMLLLTSVIWLKDHRERLHELFIYPYLFILQMSLVVGGQTWFGWHWFPLYPFIAIILAKTFVDFYTRPDLFKFIFFYISLAASSLRFVMLITDNKQWDWSKILGIGFAMVVVIWQLPNLKLRKTLLVSLFLIFISINIMTVFYLKEIYPTLPQPLL